MAATMQNYSDSTFLSDLVTRPEFLAYIDEAVYNQCQWIQSGVVTRNSALDCRAGGVRVRVPFYQPYPATSEQIRSDATWGDSGAGYLTPKKITGAEQIMTILHRGGAYGADDLSRMGTGSDPMAAIQRYLTSAILKLRTNTLLSQLDGIFGDALADNVNDVSQSTTGATEANFLTASNVVGTQALLGERGDDLNVIGMHSNVAFYLRSVGALTFSTSALSTGGAITWGGGGIGLTNTEVQNFMGFRVIVDDMLAPTVNVGGADQYPVYLMGSGSVAEGVQRDLRTEFERNILSQQDVMTWTSDYGFHLFGTSWNSATDNPTNTQLGTSTNWDCVYGGVDTGNAGDGPKLVPVAKLIVNSPLAANV